MTDEIYTKSCAAIEVEKFDAETGEITAVVSSIGNADVVNDIMAPGSFDKYIDGFGEGSKLPMFLQHSDTNIVGEWTSFAVKGSNIIGQGQIYTETTAGSDALALVRRGLVGSTSIGFKSSDYEANEKGGRTFNEVSLVETSLVINPANPRAKIRRVKNEDGQVNVRELEKSLREMLGLSSQEAKALISEGKDGLRDVVDSEKNDNNVIDQLKQLMKEV